MVTTASPVIELERLDTLVQVDRVLARDVFQPLVAQVTTLLARYADSRGQVPLAKLPAIRDGAHRQVIQTMLGRTGSQEGVPHPYVEHGGRVYPQSPYFVALFGLMHRAASEAVNVHADLMRRYLPLELVELLERATLDPFSPVVHELSDADLRLEYDPLHRWIGPDGKQLSDRIWQVTGDMGRKLDAYLTQAVARNVPVPIMAQELERYLIPGTSHELVNTPYGQIAYEAMRLARTEVSAARHRADSAAAQMNPLVEGYSFFTAPEHQCCDHCDVVQAGNPYPKDDVTHLPPQHPNCICGVIWHLIEDIGTAVNRLIDLVKDAIKRGVNSFVNWIGPLSKRFLDRLFRGQD